MVGTFDVRPDLMLHGLTGNHQLPKSETKSVQCPEALK